MRQKLESQSDRIEAVLTLHKVQARVSGGTVTPQWVRFQVLPAVGVKLSVIKSLDAELAVALDAQSCRVSRRGAAVTVEIPRDDPQSVRLLPLFHQLHESAMQGPGKGLPPLTAVLGLGEDGTPLMVRLPSPDVGHVLVAGATGAGKTVLLQSIILSLAMVNSAAGLALLLVDPKGHAFANFKELPHLARAVITEQEESVEALHSLVRLMVRRADRGWGAPVVMGGTERQHVLVVIDELADLLMSGGKEVQWALTRLTQRGRERGIYVIAATKEPTSVVLGPLVKSNFPVRLVGRMTSIEDGRTATGWSGTGAEQLVGRGDFLAVAEGRVTRFQAAHVSPGEILAVVTGILEGRSVAMRRTCEVQPSGRVALPCR